MHKICVSLAVLSFMDMVLSEAIYDTKLIEQYMRGYDHKIRPEGADRTKRNGGPVVIFANILLRTISKIDDVNMEFSTQFTFRQHWNDKRLAYGNRPHPNDSTPAENGTLDYFILLPGDHTQQVWLPDTFFQNEKSAQKHMVDKPNILIRVYSNGDVLYSVRLSLVLSCTMSLVYYPLDQQNCTIDFSSYAYTMEDVMYKWTEQTPIQIKEMVNKSLPSFILSDVTTGQCSSNTSTGVYSCQRIELHFQRMFSYYLLQLYIPSFMLVIVSWVSFWVDKSSVPARVTLGVTTLLTITTQASGINAKLPPVSYTKAIDVWIGVCLAFVFGALLEYALVNYAGNVESSQINDIPNRHRERLLSCVHSSSSQDHVTVDAHGTTMETSPMCNQCNNAARQHLHEYNQHRRTCLPSNGHTGKPYLQSPLIGRPNVCYRVSDEETGHIPRAAYYSSSHDMQNHPDAYCNTSFLDTSLDTANFKQPVSFNVHSLADRRIPLMEHSWRPVKPPVYIRLMRWAVALYNEADRAKKIDVVSRVGFPMLFFMFNCVYWIVY